MTTYTKGDRVIIYDMDDEIWYLGKVIKVIEDWQEYDLRNNFFPIHLPDEHEIVYCIQYYDHSGETLRDQVTGIYVGVEWVHKYGLIVPDSPMARAIYLEDINE